MKNFTLFKRQMMFVVFMLLGCMSIHAADDGLITEQITIKLDKAGTLPDKIADKDKYKITNLKIIGEINGTDWVLIRELAGRNHTGAQLGEPVLNTLDLSEAKIVEGGDYYYAQNYYYDEKNDVYLPEDPCYTSNDCLGDCAFAGCQWLTSLILPPDIVSIGEFALSGCFGLTNLIIPSGVTSIGNCAFESCGGLTSLTIPSSVTSMGDFTFRYCFGLTNLIIPSGVTSIGNLAFSGCYSLTSLTIPSGVTSIGNGAFEECRSLTSLSIPSSVTSIGRYAFKGCRSITSLSIPSSVTSIGEEFLYGCSSLTSIYVSWLTPLNITINGYFLEPYSFMQNCKLYVPQGTSRDYKRANGWMHWGINIVEYDPTGIDKVTISSDAKEHSRYSVNGQRLSVPTKGLNIVKYSDGSVKKVAVQ